MNNKYTFETDSNDEMELVVLRHKMLAVLYELSNWRRNIYKEYDNNLMYLCGGKLYTYAC